MISNVTATSFDHTCDECGHMRQGLSHSEIRQIPANEGHILLTIACPSGKHFECLNPALDASHETDERYSAVHRHQAQQIRQLQQHLGHRQ